MGQLNSSLVPVHQILPVIEHVLAVYKQWYQYRDHFPKKARYSLGDKIDTLFIEILELLFVASYQNPEAKLPTLETAIKKTDILKFFLRIAWEIRALDDKKYLSLSEKTQELGRMIGGWRKGLLTKTPPAWRRERILGVSRDELVACIQPVTKLPSVDVPLPIVRVPVDIDDKDRASYT